MVDNIKLWNRNREMEVFLHGNEGVNTVTDSEMQAGGTY
jgi:hypothetical protein